MDVSRGSQFQKDPQLNFAQIAPDTVARIQNNVPNAADEDAMISSRGDGFLR